MDTSEWLSDTRRVVLMGGVSLGVNIKKDIADAMELKPGSLVEIRIRNTGKKLLPVPRRKRTEGERKFLDTPDEDYVPPENL